MAGRVACISAGISLVGEACTSGTWQGKAPKLGKVSILSGKRNSMQWYPHAPLQSRIQFKQSMWYELSGRSMHQYPRTVTKSNPISPIKSCIPVVLVRQGKDSARVGCSPRVWRDKRCFPFNGKVPNDIKRWEEISAVCAIIGWSVMWLWKRAEPRETSRLPHRRASCYCYPRNDKQLNNYWNN